MPDTYLTDDRDLAAAAEHHARAARAHAEIISTDITGRVAALITAATVPIERDVGPVAAPAALMALAEPTLPEWQAAVAVAHP